MRSALLALVLAACGDSRPAPAPAIPAPTNAMRVMSYNLNFGIAGDPSTIDAIANVQADLVLLQETNAQWEAALVERLGERYPHRRFAEADPPHWLAGGMGLLSEYPIVSIDKLPAPEGGIFFAWRVVLDTALGRIQVLNVHLRPPMSDGGSWVVGYWSTRGDRLREVEYHAAALDPKLPTLIVGDFNEENDGRAMQRLADLGYTDAIERFAGDRPTWSWPVGSYTLKFQLDHILHDDRLIPITAAIVEAGRSDHKPIWADFARD